LCNEIPLVFSGQLYATASWIGALLLIAMEAFGAPPGLSSLGGASMVLALRLGAIRFGWRLPVIVRRGY